jgi:hypothetical protein
MITSLKTLRDTFISSYFPLLILIWVNDERIKEGRVNARVYLLVLYEVAFKWKIYALGKSLVLKRKAFCAM